MFGLGTFWKNTARRAVLFALLPAVAATALDLTACLEGLSELHQRSLENFKQYYLSFRSESDNAHFIRSVEGKVPKGMVFFHVENAVLKSLNDRIFRDRALTAAVEGLYTKRLLANLEAMARRHPRLKHPLFYSDYKTTRFGFRGEIRELEPLLAELHRKTAEDFLTSLKEFPALLGLIKEAHIAGQPLSWHMAGIGHTPAEASTAARVARYHYAPEVPFTPLKNFQDRVLQKELEQGLHRLEDLRDSIQRLLTRLFTEKAPMLVRPDGKRPEAVLNQDAITILRRLAALEGDGPFLEQARAQFAAHFELKVESKLEQVLFDKALLAAREYYQLIDHFSPSIYEREEVMDLGIEGAKHGVLSVDLAGQNVRNLQQLMVSLSRASHSIVPEGMTLAEHAVQLARQGQDVASHEFQWRRETLRLAIERWNVPGEMRISGDDCIFVPSRELTTPEKQKLVLLMGELGHPADFRMAFLSRYYGGTKTVIAPRKRASYLAMGEAIEKELRVALDTGKTRWPLRSYLFAVDIVPREAGGAEVSLIVGGKVDGPFLNAVRLELERILPAGLKLGTVTHASFETN